MTSRNWVKFFISTLLLGGLSTGITGFIVRWEQFAPFFQSFDVIEIISILFWLFGVGLIFSLLSQAGFFAYLTIHRFGLGIFKSVPLWNTVQVILIAVVLVDLVYLRYAVFADKGESIFPQLLLALVVLLPGLGVAYLKAKQSNKSTFIPALFFMVVVTVIEWVPVLRVDDNSWIYLMVFPLIICNAYQLLTLQKINQKSMEEKKGRHTTAQMKKPSNA